MKENNMYEEVRNWIYRNARPLDLARWQYHFENGSKEAVLTALAQYQNKDGGFGHALEADSWNPNTAPIQTYTAVEILEEINFTGKNHPTIQGILKYLDSGADFNGRVWLNNVMSNNEYPHAPWWHAGSGSISHNDYNPTAGLAGFALHYTERSSKLYQKCLKIAAEAVNYLRQTEEIDMHTLVCYISLMEHCEQAGIMELFSLPELKAKLLQMVGKCITMDTSIWATSYICKPSQFFKSKESIFYEDNKEIARCECQFIKDSCNAEGVWDITWGWSAYPEEWAVSKNWWKGNQAIRNMLFLKNIGGL